MLREVRPALMVLLIMTILTGIGYPLAVTGLAQVIFPWQANGSLIEKDGKVVGSVLIGQAFTGPDYFWSRPSATTAPDPNDAARTVPAPYNAANSGGSNLAPSAKALMDRALAVVETVKAAHPDQKGPVPVDLVTASASGLDPHLSPAAAAFQANRVALARHAPLEDVRKLVAAHTEGRELGMLGEPRVNVLKLNTAMDERWPRK